VIIIGLSWFRRTGVEADIKGFLLFVSSTESLNPTSPSASFRKKVAQRMLCNQITTMQDHSRYSVSDPANPQFQAFATLDYSTLTSLKQDELTLTIRTKLDNGQRSTVLRGGEQFKKILAHFAGRFTSIRGSWSYDDNLEAFNRAVAAGGQPEEAALKTWTGQQAAAAGIHTSCHSVSRRAGRRL
jgi:hypothetical protein